MIETEYQLIREALVREIRDANRWHTVVDAWSALLSVRAMAKSLLDEQRLHNQSIQPTGNSESLR